MAGSIKLVLPKPKFKYPQAVRWYRKISGNDKGWVLRNQKMAFVIMPPIQTMQKDYKQPLPQ